MWWRGREDLCFDWINGIDRLVAIFSLLSLDYLYRRSELCDSMSCATRVVLDTAEELANRIENGSLLRLVIAYRTHGHSGAYLDPLDIMERK